MNVFFSLLASNTPDWFSLLSGLIGGLALFLFGMSLMTDGLKAVAGDGLRALLTRLTTNRWMAAVTGAIVTAICQSSSVTTVLVVGFVSADLMSVTQTIGIIMGANVGSTVTAQLIAFKIVRFALPMIAVGFAFQMLSRRELWRQLGGMLLGMGLIFYGMELMSISTDPLRSYDPFLQIMQNMDNVLLAVLVAALFTAIIQSSAATTGIVIVLASQGFLTLESGIAMVWGANIGTCITAALATIGKSRAAVRVAVVHILFNVVGVIIWLPLLTYFAEFVQEVSPAAAYLQGAAKVTAEMPRQIANAHTIFNVANVLLLIWFTGPISRLVTRLVPDRRDSRSGPIQPKYLDPTFLDTPGLALDRVRLELGRLGNRVVAMAEVVPRTIVEGNRIDLMRIEKMDDDVDALYAATLQYLRQIGARDLSQSQSGRLQDLLEIANYLESIGDLIETNMVTQGRRRLEYHLEFSPSTREVLTPLHQEAMQTLRDAIQGLADGDLNLAAQIVERKSEIDRLATLATDHLGQRLLADEPNRIHAFQVEADIIAHLRRIYYYAKRMAKVIARDRIGHPASIESA